VLAAPGWAQVVPPTPTTNSAESLEVPEELSDIPGLAPGMAFEEWRAVAWEAIQAERWRDAIRVLVHLSNLNRQDLDTLRLLAYAYERRSAEARDDPADPDGASKADAMLKEAVAVYMVAAPIAAARGQTLLAIRFLDQVLRYQPQYPPALLTMARIQTQSGASLEAVETYKKYVRTPAGEKDPQAHLELGRLFRMYRYFNHAIGALKKGLEEDPESAEIYAELAMAYLDSKAYDDAMKAIDEAVRRAPRNPEFQHILSKVLAVRNQPKESNTAAREAIRLARAELQESPGDVGKLTALKGYYETYQTTLQAYLSVDPENLEVRIDLARAAQEMAEVIRALNVHQALAVLLQAGESGENSIRWLEAVIELQFQVQRYEDALEFYRKLIKLDPTNAVARRIYEDIPERYKTALETQPAEPVS
jgi:tetratricopeptide (TPR) repeat protein